MRSGYLPGYPVPRDQWVEKGDSCAGCGKRFTFFTSKSNCPNCGRLFCSDCLQAECTIAPGTFPVQTCLPCFSMLQDFKRRQQAAREEQRMQRSVPPAEQPPPPRAEPSLSPRRGGGESGADSSHLSAPSVSAADYAELKAQLDALLAKSRELRKENEELVTSANLKDEVIANATKSLAGEREESAKHEARCRELEEKLSATRTESQQLSSRVRELTRESEGRRALEERCRRYDEEVKQLKEALAEREQEERRTSSERETSSTDAVALMEQRVRELESAARETEARSSREKARLEEELSRAHAAVREKDRELEVARAEAEQDKQVRSQYDEHITELREQLSLTMDQLEHLNEKANEDARETISLLEEQAKKLTREKMELENELRRAEEHARALAEELSRQREDAGPAAADKLSADVKTEEREVPGLTEQNSALEERITQMERQFAQRQEVTENSAQQGVSALEEEVATLARSRGELQQALKEAQASAEVAARDRETAVSAAADALANEVAALKAALAAETEKAGVARDALRASEERLSALQASLSEEAAARQSAEAARDAAQAASAARTDETAAEAERLRAAVQQSSQQLRVLHEETKTQAAQLKDVQDENSSLKSTVEEQRKTISELRQSAAELKSQSEMREARMRESGERAAAASQAAAERENAALAERVAAVTEAMTAAKKERDAAVAALGWTVPLAQGTSIVDVVPPPRDGASRWRQPSLTHPIRFAVPPASALHSATAELPEKSTLFRWGYDIAAAAEKVPSVLQAVATAAARKMDLFRAGTNDSVDQENLRRWQTMAAMVEANYRENPYHTSTHAADVTQGVCALLLAAPDITQHLTRTEKLGAVFAALVHDVRHPGRTQTFLRAVFDPVYFQYSGQSVLEQMHVATAFALLAVPEADFTVGMSDAEALEFHGVVASMVAATDMSQHHAALAVWQEKAKAKTFDFTRAEDRREVLRLLLHAADVGAQAKGVSVAMRWVSVVEEMYQQGDEEKRRHLAVSPGCERPTSSHTSRPSLSPVTADEGGPEQDVAQLRFMRAIVAPLFHVVHALVPSLSAPLENLRALHAFYQQRCGDTTAFPEDRVARDAAAALPHSSPTHVPAPGGERNGLAVAALAVEENAAEERTAAVRRVEEQAAALREAYAKVKAAALSVAKRDTALRRKEDALKSLEARIVEDLRGVSATRGNGEGTVSPAAAHRKTGGGTPKMTSELSRSSGQGRGGEPDGGNDEEEDRTAEIEEKLLRVTARVVEREQQVRDRARELERQAKDLEERERLTTALSDQLAAIAERVNRQRRKLARHEAQLSLPSAPDDGTRSSPRLSSRYSPSSDAPGEAVFAIRESKDVVLQRLGEAVHRLNSAVRYAP